MTRSHAWVALALVATGCTLLGREGDDGRPIDDRVGVVPEEEPFDPALAVDDEDGPLAEALQGDGAPVGMEEEPAPSSGGEGAEERAEVAERRVEKVAEHAAASDAPDDDAAKTAAAHNPPPEPIRRTEPAPWTALDALLDALVLGVTALGLTLLIVLGRNHWKVAAGALATGIALLVFLGWQLG